MASASRSTAGTPPRSGRPGPASGPQSATGAGPLTLQFDAHAQHGDLVLVAMNADGSPSVGGHVATAATVPALPWIVAGLLAAGAVLLAGSAALIVKPARRRSGRGAPATT